MNKTEFESDQCAREHSLLTAMNRFVGAVNDMDDTVMIPCKLKDIPVEDSNCNQSVEADRISVTSSDENILMNFTGSMPVSQEQVSGLIEPNSKPAADSDLYSFYKMLKSIKTELVRGPEVDAEESNDSATEMPVPEAETDSDYLSSDTSECSDVICSNCCQGDLYPQDTATHFRHHLRGLYGILKQLTGTANFLTSRYQQELGDCSDTKLNNFSTL